MTGKYQMSINSWLWTADRNEILDFVQPNRMISIVLCHSLKASELDYGLAIRPFTPKVWKSIGVTLIVGLALLCLPHFFIRGWDGMSANSTIKLSLWLFFVLIQAYYGGAMTMFFATEIVPPFENLREVLQAFPKWNLVFTSGLEPYFKIQKVDLRIA